MRRYILLVLPFILQRVLVEAFSSATPSATSSPKLQSEETETNVNFVDWISDAPDQIKTWKSLKVKGEIPSYVEGTLVRNGGGIWTEDGTSQEEHKMFSHIFDGLAKIHAYKITKNDENNEASVQFQTRFLEGEWYNKYSQQQKLPVAIGTGPVLDANQQPITGFWQTLKVATNILDFDNTPVNIWDYQPNASGGPYRQIVAMTDAPPRTTIQLDSMNTLSSSTMNPLAKHAQGFELLCTAHPLYAQNAPIGTATYTYNVAVEIGIDGPRVNLVQECTNDVDVSDRTIVASFASEDGIPYFHSFGISKNYAVLVLQPLRVDALDLPKTVEKGFLRGMQHVDKTRIVVVDLHSQEIVLDQSIDEKIYFYHSISTAELTNENGQLEVSLRLCAYKTPDQLTGEHQFMRLEQARQGRDYRNKIHKGGLFCDVVCNLEEQSVTADWKEDIKQGFELPVTRYSRSWKDDFFHPSSVKNPSERPHPRYTYAFGAYALGSSDYDSWGLFKFDLEENKVAGCYSQDSVYISEPAFVADPNGQDEDDGVLVTHAYFGREQETKLLVLDAKTMKILAEASTESRAPLDFHGAWIPKSIFGSTR